MKSEKGVTLISLIVYLILLIFVITILSIVSSYFYTNLDKVGDMGKNMAYFNKFNMYFIEDIKNNTEVYSTENNKLILGDGTIYTFTENSIYRNKNKICENIESLTFTQREEVDENDFEKIVINVQMTISGSQIFEMENDYVLNYWDK